MSRHDDPMSPHWFDQDPSSVPCGRCGGEVAATDANPTLSAMLREVGQ